MSLRRRIALAAACAVAAVAVAISVVGYVTTRSHLIGEVQDQLQHLAQNYLRPHDQGEPPDGGGGGPGEGPFPGPVERGGAAGIFQVVQPDGTILVNNGLPITRQVLGIARRGSGSTFYEAPVGNTQYESYAVWDAPDQHVVQVALPLTEANSVLNGLLLPYGLLIAGGVVLAAVLGLAISRTALSPIERFTRRTEDATSELEHPHPLEETGPTELKRLAASFNQALDALERSIQAQRNLVADASHELRTPIAALRSNIQIFLESERLPVQERESLQGSIIAELDELTQLVDNVVELARDSSAPSHREPVELDTVVRDAVERTRRRAPNLEFRLKLDPTIVQGTPDRIGRAVTNIIDNARKWSPPDGVVDVRLHGGTLSVRDRGPGFAEQDLPHVFDRFYRAADARRLPGSGLGLAIVRQAARAHGGQASAANAADGGAVVEVSFGPALSQPPAGAKAAEVKA
jgi:two-component system sensor histidine kinase MprB